VSPDLRFLIGGRTTEVRIVETFDPAILGSAGGRVTVFDETTRALFWSGAENPVVLPPGESAKRWASVEAILERCAAVGMGRDGTVIGVGGGVVCDLAAFAASLYMRGCGLVLAPTTLLAMVDACLGGKTGIDFLGYKNLVGTFYPASLIVVATAGLRSLPEPEFRSGIAEAIKTAIIGDRALFDLLRAAKTDIDARDDGILAQIVRRSLAVKGRIVQEDPMESGIRAQLNLGHTFGHALESATGFSTWRHGEAVAWGIGRAIALGLRLGLTDRPFAEEVEAVLRLYGFRLDGVARLADLTSALARDKKRRGGRLRLVIPRDYCDVVVREADDGALAEVLGG
jgi:3-dehydroquinate synthase